MGQNPQNNPLLPQDESYKTIPCPKCKGEVLTGVACPACKGAKSLTLKVIAKKKEDRRLEKFQLYQRQLEETHQKIEAKKKLIGKVKNPKNLYQ